MTCLRDRVLHPCFAVRTLYLHEGMPYIIIMEHYNYNIIYVILWIWANPLLCALPVSEVLALEWLAWEVPVLGTRAEKPTESELLC